MEQISFLHQFVKMLLNDSKWNLSSVYLRNKKKIVSFSLKRPPLPFWPAHGLGPQRRALRLGPAAALPAQAHATPPTRLHSRACVLTPVEAYRRVAPPVVGLLTTRPRAAAVLALPAIA